MSGPRSRHEMIESYAALMDPDNPVSPLHDLDLNNPVTELLMEARDQDLRPYFGWPLPDEFAARCPLNAAILRDAQVFDFGELHLDDTQDRRSYVMDLFQMGVLSIPYPAVHYRLRHEFTEFLLVANRVEARHFQLSVFFRAMLTVAQPFFHCAVGFLRFDNERIYWWAVPSVFAVGVEVRFSGRCGWDSAFEYGVSRFLDCSLVLATKGVRKETMSAPKFINQQRVRKGKPRLPSVTHIDFKAYDAARAAGASKSTHASPVPHLRRGHIREWHGRRIWVRDCIVNGSDEMREAHRREKYVVHEVPSDGSDSEVRP